MHEKTKKRVLARLLSEDLRLASGGDCPCEDQATATFTNNNTDYTNVGGDED